MYSGPSLKTSFKTSDWAADTPWCWQELTWKAPKLPQRELSKQHSFCMRWPVYNATSIQFCQHDLTHKHGSRGNATSIKNGWGIYNLREWMKTNLKSLSSVKREGERRLLKHFHLVYFLSNEKSKTLCNSSCTTIIYIHSNLLTYLGSLWKVMESILLIFLD